MFKLPAAALGAMLISVPASAEIVPYPASFHAEQAPTSGARLYAARPAAEYPARVKRFVLIDAPLPGVGPWDEIVRSRALWHFSFQTATMRTIR